MIRYDLRRRVSVHIPSPGTLFAGRYRIDAVLGHGAIGVVLSATDEKTGVDCALKLLSSPELGNDRARLVREARALMLITNPHVVRVFDVGEDDDAGPFLVLERLEGADLGTVAPLGHPLEPARVIDYVAQVCVALAAAHAADIIHRDIKPSNIFLARTPAGSTIKVLDFGVSKVSPGDGHGSLTNGDSPLGSPQFISPEQLASPRAVDARTDIWAVGVVMYRLLSGAFPFSGSTVAETFALVAKGERAALRSVAPHVPPTLAVVVERCLEREPAKRFASAEALRRALLALSEDAPALRERAARPTPGLRPWLLFGLGLIVTLGLGGVFAATRHPVLPREVEPGPAPMPSAPVESAPSPVESAPSPVESAPSSSAPETAPSPVHSASARPRVRPHPTKKGDPGTSELRDNPYR